MTTGLEPAPAEIVEAFSWLSAKCGILLVRPKEIHVYCGPVHKWAPRPEPSSDLSSILSVIKQVRLERDS